MYKGQLGLTIQNKRDTSETTEVLCLSCYDDFVYTEELTGQLYQMLFLSQ